jgi:hypothetical protein
MNQRRKVEEYKNRIYTENYNEKEFKDVGKEKIKSRGKEECRGDKNGRREVVAKGAVLLNTWKRKSFKLGAWSSD